jgi:hypothetical protein
LRFSDFFDDLLFKPLGIFDFGVTTIGHHPAFNFNVALGIETDFHPPILQYFYFLFRVPLSFEDPVGDLGPELDRYSERIIIAGEFRKGVGEFFLGVKLSCDFN